MFHLPVGEEAIFIRKESYTVIRREGQVLLRVYTYRQNTG